MPFDAILISDVSIDEFLKIDEAEVVCDLNTHECKICLEYAEKIPVSEFRTSLGGNSANVAAGLAKLGLNVSVFSQIGNDANGNRFVTELKERGVDNSLLVQNPGETDIHSILIYKGERTILSYHRPKNYKIPNWEEPKWIYYSSLPKSFENFQSQLMKYLGQHPNVLTAFNPGVYHFKAGFRAYEPFLKVTDVLFVNKEEALRILSQAGVKSCKPDTKLVDIHRNLQKLGPNLTVITDAENGASVSDNSNFVMAGIVKSEKPVADKTGAGDAFASAFLAALMYGKSAKTALQWGLKNSSACIREIGPMNGLLNKQQIEA